MGWSISFSLQQQIYTLPTDSGNIKPFFAWGSRRRSWMHVGTFPVPTERLSCISCSSDFVQCSNPSSSLEDKALPLDKSNRERTAEHPHTVIMEQQKAAPPPARGRAIASRRHRDLPGGDKGVQNRPVPASNSSATHTSIYRYWDIQSPFTLEKKVLYLHGIQGRHMHCQAPWIKTLEGIVIFILK